MGKLKVGVVRGGFSTEREVSLKTGQEIINNLNKEKYDVVDIVLEDKNKIFEQLKEEKLDFVYIALHGLFGEDGKIQSILETMNIAYSGPSVLTSAVCMDKEMTKRLVSMYGVTVAKGVSIKFDEKANYEKISEKLGKKFIVKPNSGGSSIGVSFVENQSELEEALKLVFSMDKEALIEEVLVGEEISVPVIGGKVFPTLKIEALAGKYFDYKSKYNIGGAREYVYEYEESVQSVINDFAQKCYCATKCAGFARIDFMIVDGKKPYFMEVNTLPGMTSASLLPKSTLHVGYSYSETLDLLIEESLKIKR